VTKGTTVGGYNPAPGASDVSMKIGSVTGSNYTVNVAGEPTATPSASGCSGSKPADQCTSSLLRINAECINGQWDYDDLLCNRAGRIKVCGGKQYCCPKADGSWTTNMISCQSTTVTVAPTSTRTPTSTKVPTATPGGVSDGFPWLKFRMAFLGVTPVGECSQAKIMPLRVSVMAPNGTMKSYDVVASKANNTGSLAFYDVSLKLDGFNYTDDLAVFVKGPRHLQIKYGVDGQNEYYDKAGGEIGGLTLAESTTPMFNFESYPLLAGDVTGPGGVQDGQVDGLDFSKVKTEVGKMTTVGAGEFLVTDVNGNCTMESQDLALLMLSLAVRQSQMY